MQNNILSRKIDEAFLLSSSGGWEIRCSNGINPIKLESEAYFGFGPEAFPDENKTLITVNELMQSYDAFFPQANRGKEPFAFTHSLTEYERWKQEVVRGLQVA